LNSNLYKFLKFVAYLNLNWKKLKNRKGNWADSRQPSCTRGMQPLAQCSAGGPWPLGHSPLLPGSPRHWSRCRHRSRPGLARVTAHLLPAARPCCTRVKRAPATEDLARRHDVGRHKGRTPWGSLTLSRGAEMREYGATLGSGRWLTKNEEGTRGLDRASSHRWWGRQATVTCGRGRSERRHLGERNDVMQEPHRQVKLEEAGELWGSQGLWWPKQGGGTSSVVLPRQHWAALWQRPARGTERGDVADNWSTRWRGWRLTAERWRRASDERCWSTGGFNSRVEDDAATGGCQVGDVAWQAGPVSALASLTGGPH
jgi:hypothetical protein